MARDETFNDRAWLAWHCLPRDKEGKLPTQSGLEITHGLSKGTFYKVFKGATVQAGTLPAFAAALNVSQEWLTTGKGPRPKPTGHLPPRPGTPEALIPAPMSGEPSKGVRRGDLPGWADAERAARRKEAERYQWSVRGAREVVMEAVPISGEINAEYVLAIAALVRAHASNDERARLEELEIQDEKMRSSRSVKRTSR